MFFCEATGCNDKTSKKSEVTWTSKGSLKPTETRCKGWWTHCVFLQIFMQLGIQAASLASPKKVREKCFQGGVLENFGFRDGKPQEGFFSEEIQQCNQCLKVFESGLQPVRMQFRWWHVSCSWKACIAKCNRGTGTLAVSCNFCGGAVSSSGALAYFKELVK